MLPCAFFLVSCEKNTTHTHTGSVFCSVTRESEAEGTHTVFYDCDPSDNQWMHAKCVCVCVCVCVMRGWHDGRLSLSLSRGGEGVSVTGCSDSWSTADRIYQTQPRPWSVPACNSAVCLPHLASRNGLDAARFCMFCVIISDSDVFVWTESLPSFRLWLWLNVCCVQRPSREFCVFKGLTTEEVLSPNSRLTD